MKAMEVGSKPMRCNFVLRDPHLHRFACVEGGDRTPVDPRTAEVVAPSGAAHLTYPVGETSGLPVVEPA